MTSEVLPAIRTTGAYQGVVVRDMRNCEPCLARLRQLEERIFRLEEATGESVNALNENVNVLEGSIASLEQDVGFIHKALYVAANCILDEIDGPEGAKVRRLYAKYGTPST